MMSRSRAANCSTFSSSPVSKQYREDPACLPLARATIAEARQPSARFLRMCVNYRLCRRLDNPEVTLCLRLSPYWMEATLMAVRTER